MQWLDWKSLPNRVWFAVLALGSWGLVGVGMELQALLRLSPCPLCIFQRLLYLVLGALALFGLFWPRGRRLLAGAIMAIATGGFATAAYQTWMQAFPHLAPECSFTDPNAIERLVDQLGMLWPSLFLATGFCTSREWEFLSLSMANWSMLIFAGIAALAAWLTVKK